MLELEHFKITYKMYPTYPHLGHIRPRPLDHLRNLDPTT